MKIALWNVSDELDQDELNQIELSIQIMFQIGIWRFGWSVNLKINLEHGFELGLGDMIDCGCQCKPWDFTNGASNAKCVQLFHSSLLRSLEKFIQWVEPFFEFEWLVNSDIGSVYKRWKLVYGMVGYLDI